MFIVGSSNNELKYVDVEAARNGGYGYLDSFTLPDMFYIGDYVKLAKAGHTRKNNYYPIVLTGAGDPVLIGQSNWKLTDQKVTQMPNILAEYMNLTFTHTISGTSFRSVIYKSHPTSPWLLNQPLVTEDNLELYKEINQNASWLIS